MSWLSSWFRSNAFKIILDMGKKILIQILGKFGSDLHQVALEEVEKAEASGLDGMEKYKMAFEAIKRRVPGIGESAINLAIELSVQAILKK